MMKVIRNDKRPIWQQLLDQAIYNITNGIWAPGELLIPSRELAHMVGVSRSTIQIVYEELLSRGYTITSRRGGTRVSQWNQVTESTKEIITDGPIPPSLPLLNSAVDQLHDWFRGKEQREVDIDFSPHEPYLDGQFQKNWRQSLLHASAEMDESNWAYGNPYGFTPLREQIQRYLSLERGIHIQTNQILLTSGAQHSIDLIAQSLLSDGDTVSVEDPGFPASWMAMKYRRMNVVPVPVDEYGLVVEHIHPQSKLIFVTPSHQCAVGVVMSEPRRQQLLHKATKDQSWIIEDDYDSEFRYRGDPLPTLFSQAPQNTLYLMSFSKMIAPGIRISAIVGSVEAIAQLARVQELTYRHLPIMDQLTLTHFIKNGHFMRHMRRVRNVYRRRHEAMTKAIMASGLGERFTLSGAETGLHMLLEAEESYDEETVTTLALQQGIRVYPLGPYCLESTRKGWVLGFAQVDEASIEQGIHRLSELILCE
ncbi:MocR-like pyridoxine biosynthesis transcription factor PdxR [Paenibacillus macquariensis]|uniref:GntR family transcriptional regulator / MocR family aminotransferase n=1 Tax=Paenibacillus macquariensis TaxID=948756 RepID=A0ABY1KAE5_9BACL|nr:PLP-dependent aminotransferase family protein [Paenibacillus macquariensis]MEC0093711.1 PLP-dependent aminotransferase family protein [Paenibacillus macquariensis]OAB31658.1 transcriptional regulator [Paenibacillus macquariensis subsp. macquariensis]SIR50543.1 GntR family transcriptional regulator / MocR family aminotransferase [Paenibacillus macquariensis]